MNPDRSMDTFSPLHWLNVVQRGSTEDWKGLYRLRRDPEVAQAVASVLPWRDPDLLPSARLWKYLLEDLHPGLDLGIELQEESTGVGV